ncbi:hypothetical protein HPP92_006963 [Vanilla planifolia]|uniref:Uncharacterized protein n=1 Tax=Vanilla planifolia TaxID=51239 RepID=A0A835RD73_VANPL|nr:hypothetical protein HPP92_006963 [Vanilla planifolia]
MDQDPNGSILLGVSTRLRRRSHFIREELDEKKLSCLLTWIKDPQRGKQEVQGCLSSPGQFLLCGLFFSMNLFFEQNKKLEKSEEGPAGGPLWGSKLHPDPKQCFVSWPNQGWKAHSGTL